MNCPSLAPCCPFTSPICRAHLLPSAPPLLLLLLLAACLPRRSRGKRASCLLTQTWAIVNLALALPLARMILPPPLPGRGTCRMIPQGWMGWAGGALPQTPPLAHSLQLPAPPERPWRWQPSLADGNSLASPEKFFGEMLAPTFHRDAMLRARPTSSPRQGLGTLFFLPVLGTPFCLPPAGSRALGRRRSHHSCSRACWRGERLFPGFLGRLWPGSAPFVNGQLFPRASAAALRRQIPSGAVRGQPGGSWASRWQEKKDQAEESEVTGQEGSGDRGESPVLPVPGTLCQSVLGALGSETSPRTCR